MGEYMLALYGGGEIRLYRPLLRDGAVGDEAWNGGGGVEKVCPPASRFAIEAAATSFSCTGINQRYKFYKGIIHYCIAPNNYKDTKSEMSSLLVFNRVYRQEIHTPSVMLVFSTPLVN
jgi:hypothetical protein